MRSDRPSNPDALAWPPTRTDMFGVLCAFVVVYCLVERTWQPLASLALVIGAFAVALPRMIGRWRVGGAPPLVEGEFSRQAAAQAPPLAPEKGSDVG
jgi:hypothetical protein